MSTTYATIERPDGRIVAYSDSGPQDDLRQHKAGK
jgi:hypothetical protein